MHQEGRVDSIEVTDHGRKYRATYYVEHGVLHANLVGKRQTTICSGVPPEDLVRALLAERIIEIGTLSDRDGRE